MKKGIVLFTLIFGYLLGIFVTLGITTIYHACSFLTTLEMLWWWMAPQLFITGPLSIFCCLLVGLGLRKK